ncbi:hypothetical protein [Kitasatospora sp. GP82]|uniref:DUF6197 family protein n=1 Tax=Kitasatospora sp. GP82 TaxID=3035089 RepID=UPI002474D71A|nr:hypothetical protein [Kitasatospora sp. GP82]MDH6125938.1 hypothetical protein [Kitasatospora sp. GP82]
MLATLTAPRIDLDAASLLLVAEVEDYLRTTATTQAPAAGPGPLDLDRLLATAPAPRHGSTVQSWHAEYPAPTATLTDRLFRRQPIAAVTVQQHLQLVSRYITHHGWTQGALWDREGRVCVLGAQLRVLAAGYGTAATATRARQRIGSQLGYQGHPIPVDQWNDQPGRRQADVHQLLQRAATSA